VLRDPTLRLGARSLANELAACALRGEAPGPQPEITRALQRAPQARPVARRPEPDDGVALPVLRPRTQVRSTVQPTADRADREPRRVVVAIIDSGVVADHRDVRPGTVLAGHDLVNPCGDGRQDVTGHGTAVAGVLLSNHYGAAPEVDVLPIRISLATGRHSSFASALGIVLATRGGADIINMSYTAQRVRPSVAEWLAVRYAARRGVALVAAAGNDPDRPAGWPAAHPEVLSVTSVDALGRLSPFSARTGRIDVAAPGARVLTLSSTGSVRVASGTSLSAPLVTGSLVHMLQADPGVSPDRVVATVRATRQPLDASQDVAHRFGAIDFSAALAGVCAISSACQLTAALPHTLGLRHEVPVVTAPLPGVPR
jgi:subtilisin family serine protease